MATIGTCMSQSHYSSRDDFGNSMKLLDTMQRLAEERGSRWGVAWNAAGTHVRDSRGPKNGTAGFFTGCKLITSRATFHRPLIVRYATVRDTSIHKAPGALVHENQS